MRKIRIIEQISLDGVIQAPGGRDEGGDDYAHGGWAAPYRGTAMGEAVALHGRQCCGRPRGSVRRASGLVQTPLCSQKQVIL